MELGLAPRRFRVHALRVSTGEFAFVFTTEKASVSSFARLFQSRHVGVRVIVRVEVRVEICLVQYSSISTSVACALARERVLFAEVELIRDGCILLEQLQCEGSDQAATN